MPIPLLVGCRNSADTPAQSVTYYRDIAPLLSEHCANCHRPGEAAPFSLLTYEDAQTRAGQIAEVTASRFMPPWLPEVGHAVFDGERRLSDEELVVLAAWAGAGAPAGDPSDAPAPPQFAMGWQLGQPDLILESPAFELPAAGADQFRNFLLTVPAGLDRWVRAVELRPQHPQITHHARLGIDATNESARRDAADPVPGYVGMAWGQDPPGQLITWTPGMLPDEGTEGAAWQLTPDAKLVLHTHLQPSGKPETVRFRVRFYFAAGPPSVEPLILRIGSQDIDIPAGESRHLVRDSYELPIDVDANFVFPHAHSLCREILVRAEPPEGPAQTLIAIRRFDENWHDKYRFQKPIRLVRGTKLITEFVYDNTSENIRNPHNPPQRVVYGSNADDEMADVYLQVTSVNPKQRAVLAEHHDKYELQSKLVGYRKTLELHPDDPWSREALASCYVAAGQPRQAIELLEMQTELLADSPQATVILGMAHLAVGDAEVAEDQLRRALEDDEESPLAWLGLGQVLVASKQPAEAETAFRRAVELAPRLMVARLDLVDLLVAQERWAEAIEQCEAAIQFAPTEQQPHLKLANIYARQQRYDESLEHFQAARELAPFVYSPQASLAIACYQYGDEAKAEQLLGEAAREYPSDPVPHCFLGQIARRNGNVQVSRQELAQATELPLPSTWPASHVRQFLILVYTEQLQLAQELEDTEFARRVASAWLKLEPENVGLKQLLHDLGR
ncbi:MAG: tetratricopeptide repeat protein [Bythopirellula sp.]|nr:tetratricopeptide repeat protein [Bythopirellula sp.]